MTHRTLVTEFLKVGENCTYKCNVDFMCMHMHVQNQHIKSTNFGKQHLQNKRKVAYIKLRFNQFTCSAVSTTCPNNVSKKKIISTTRDRTQ